MRKPPRRAMENFTALVMKLASADPTRPLTASRKALIQKRLPEIFPDFHTPNHPTYSAMIHRAIADMKEQEGSSEESISKFIRKKYNDLPWAHLTLLKHHLQKLCESGEIVVTSNRCYLLSNGVTTLNSGPCSSPTREPMQQMQKRRGEKLKGRARRHVKDQIKEQNQPEGEQMEVIQEQNQVQEQHNLLIEEQNLAEEPHNELIEELNVLQTQEQEQQSGLIEEQNQLEGHIMDSEHLDQNQPKVPSPDRPPGSNLMTVKELSELQDQRLPEKSPDFFCQQKNPKPQLETMTFSDFPIKAKQPQVEQQHEHPYPEELLGIMTTLLPFPTSMTSLDLATDSQLLEQEQQPEFSNSEGPLELCGQQKASKSLPLTSATSLTLPLNSERAEQCKLELPNSGRLLEVKMITEEEVGEFAETYILQPILEEQRQPQHQSQSQSECEKATVASMMELESTHKQQLQLQPHFSGLEGLQVLKSVEKLPEMQQQNGQEKQTKSGPQTIITQDEPTNSYTKSGFPNTEKCPGSKLATVVPLSQEQQEQAKLCEGQKAPESEPATLTASLDFPEPSEQRPDCSVPERPMELDLETMEQSSQTEQLQQQARERGRRKRTRFKPKNIRTQDLPSYSEQLSELPNPEQCQRPEIGTLEPFSKEEQQQAMLFEGQKAPESVLAAVTSSLDIPREFSVPVRPMELDLATMEQSSQTERMQRQLRRWVGRTSTSKALTTVITELLPSSEVQSQEPELLNKESPPELKQTPVEESKQTKEQQPKPCGQQKQIKSQPKIITDCLNTSMALLQSEQEQPPELPSPERELKQQHRQTQEKPQHRKLWPRPPKPEIVKAVVELSDCLNTSMALLQSEQEQPPELPSPEREQKQQHRQTQEKPQHRKLRPRPPKPEQAVVKTVVELLPLQHQHEQQQQHLQLPIRGTLQEFKHTAAEESTQREGQGPKLRGRRKQLPSQANTRTDSLDSPLNSQWEPKQQQEFPSPERAEQQHQQVQENPECRQLRPWHLKSEAAAATTTAELVPVQHQHEELQQLECQNRGRPLKRKYDRTSTVGESSPSDHQGQHKHKQPALRGRGRPRKYPHNHGRGRPRKYPHNPQQQQLHEQTKCRGRGRPPKPKPGDITPGNLLPSGKQLHEPQRQGRGRPRKLDEGK